MEIAELYVLPAFRQRSIASSAIIEVAVYFPGNWRVAVYFPGNWRVAVLSTNDVAYTFWRQLISALGPAFTETVPTPCQNQHFVFLSIPDANLTLT